MPKVKARVRRSRATAETLLTIVAGTWQAINAPRMLADARLASDHALALPRVIVKQIARASHSVVRANLLSVVRVCSKAPGEQPKVIYS